MKKKTYIVAALAVVMLCLFVFVGCGVKDGYEGDYECYYFQYMGTTINVSDTYEYYTITLNGKGKCTAKFKMKAAPYTSAITTSKYEIDGTNFIETVGVVKNTYTIEDDIITLEMDIEGYTATVKFKRQTEA